MIKNARPNAGGERGADGAVCAVGDATPFRIVSYFPVAFGSKCAEFAIEIEGVGELRLDLFRPPDRPAFVAPRSVRSKFSGSYERTFKLDDALAAAVLQHVEAREQGDS